jgi:hypothetical protein
LARLERLTVQPVPLPAESRDVLRAVSRPEPGAAVSHRARREESAVRCPDDAEPRRVEPVWQVPPSEPRARAAEVRERPWVQQQAAQRERPSALQAHAEAPGLPWVRLAARHEVRPAEAELLAARAVQPWEAQVAALSEVRAAQLSAQPAVLPSAARVVRLSAAPWALPSDRARLARRRMRSQRSALRSRQMREAATATAPRSRWWQEGAV